MTTPSRGARAVPLRSVDKSRLRIWLHDIVINSLFDSTPPLSLLDAKVATEAPNCMECLHRVHNRMDTPEGTVKFWASCALQDKPDSDCPDGWQMAIKAIPITPKRLIDKDVPLTSDIDAW